MTSGPECIAQSWTARHLLSTDRRGRLEEGFERCKRREDGRRKRKHVKQTAVLQEANRGYACRGGESGSTGGVVGGKTVPPGGCRYATGHEIQAAVDQAYRTTQKRRSIIRRSPRVNPTMHQGEMCESPPGKLRGSFARCVLQKWTIAPGSPSIQAYRAQVFRVAGTAPIKPGMRSRYVYVLPMVRSHATCVGRRTLARHLD